MESLRLNKRNLILISFMFIKSQTINFLVHNINYLTSLNFIIFMGMFRCLSFTQLKER